MASSDVHPVLRAFDHEGIIRPSVAAGETVDMRCEEVPGAHAYFWEDLAGAKPTKAERTKPSYGWTVPLEYAGKTYPAQIRVDVAGDETEPLKTELLELFVRGPSAIGQAQNIVDAIEQLTSAISGAQTGPQGSLNPLAAAFPLVPLGGNLGNGAVSVQLQRAGAACTPDVLLWLMIRAATRSLSFGRYKAVMDAVLCGQYDTAQTGANSLASLLTSSALSGAASSAAGAVATAQASNSVACLFNRRFLPFNDTDAYRCLKVATEAYVQVNTFAWSDENFGGLLTTSDLESLQASLGISRAELSNCIVGDGESNAPIYLVDPDGDPTQPAPFGARCATIPYLAVVRKKFSDVGIGDFLGTSNGYDRSDDCATGICLSAACTDLLHEKLCRGLLIELIWSYWHEEGMLAQTMNVISRRFQNISRPNLPDPLANLEIDPLRPLNNLIWGYLQDEQHRLSVVRRAYEYDHHYGLRLQGKAVPEMRPADSRSKFLEAFHNLLHLTTLFFRQDDDTTVVSDAFPVLNGLKEVHLILSQGAHNQFGDLPSTARQEMLIQQWLLARPEFREYLPTRAMVAYPEPWMDRVDAMKSLQGWTDTSVIHFSHLATFGEQLLLSIRFANWNFENDPQRAKTWARVWRAEIQGYIHSYRSVVGVDLAAAAVSSRETSERDLIPSFHLRRQLRRQHAPALAASTTHQRGVAPNGSKPMQRAPEPAIRRS